MDASNGKFKFEFSLEILNHLGRGLYRSFATVLAEAISNSWDAEATEVKITLDGEGFIIEDNGKGMDDLDFQNKFLNVGYSRRMDKKNISKRRIIGRKGIGKLAMLSISEEVIILSKKTAGSVTGGIINNPVLDKSIETKGKYFLEDLSDTQKNNLFNGKRNGTKIIFRKLKIRSNTEEIIRKYIATQFNFIFNLKKGDRFKIFVNDNKISEKDLKDLDDNTQFVWFLTKANENLKKRFKNLVESKTIKKTNFNFDNKDIKIMGFIASVIEPKNLLLRGSGGDFRASVNLFCNGRLRQENLFQEITSKRVTEEYLYGEIHVDGFEDEKIDRFTSSREGIIKDDPLYQLFLQKLKVIQAIILSDWDMWRRKNKEEGDIDNMEISKFQRRLIDSKNWREKDFEQKIDKNVKDKKLRIALKEKIENLSYKNIEVYQDLFILENLIREYIKSKDIKENDFDLAQKDHKDIIDNIKKIRHLRKDEEQTHSLKDRIAKEEHYLNYADLCDLGLIVDIFVNKKCKKNTPKKYQKALLADAQEIRPVRNSIMHTNEVTDDVLRWPKIKNVIDYIDKLK